MSNLTLEQRRSIISLRETGKSISFIAKRCGISRSTIYRWTERFNKDGNLNSLPKLGRNRATTDAQDAEMLAAFVSERDVNVRELSLRYNVSVKTIRKRLRANKKHQKNVRSVEENGSVNATSQLVKTEAVDLSEIERLHIIKEEQQSECTVDDDDTDSPERLLQIKAEKSQDFQRGVCRCCLSQDDLESMNVCVWTSCYKFSSSGDKSLSRNRYSSHVNQLKC